MTIKALGPGDLVEVAFVEHGKRIAYRARIVRRATRRGDWVVEVIDADADSKVEAGALLAPIMGTDSAVTMERWTAEGRS